MTHTNKIGRLHNVENSYFYRRWKICLKCNKMHIFLPEALEAGGKFTIVKEFREKMKRH